MGGASLVSRLGRLRLGWPVVFGLTVAAAGAGYFFKGSHFEERFSEVLPIAEALLEEPAVMWPPRAGGVGSTAAGRPARVDAGAPDAGPSIPELPPSRPGYQARRAEAGGLHYLEVVIGEAALDDPLPVVLVLHGRGGTAEPPGGPFLQLSHPVRAIVPQAPDRLGNGYQWLPVSVGQGLVERLSSTLFQTASELAHWVRTLPPATPVPGRVIITGFSQGGLLALTMALYHNDVVATALPLAAWLPPPLEPLHRRSDSAFPPIRSMHGDTDSIIPIGPTRLLFERIGSRGFDVQLEEFDGVGHSMNDAMNELFGQWLEAAVCRAVDDIQCEFAAETKAASLRGQPLPDAGAPADGEVPGDAAGSDPPQDAAVKSAPGVPR